MNLYQPFNRFHTGKSGLVTADNYPPRRPLFSNLNLIIHTDPFAAFLTTYSQDSQNMHIILKQNAIPK